MNPKSQSPSSSASSNVDRDDVARTGKSSTGEDARTLTSEAKRFASDVADQATKSTEQQFAGGKQRAADAIEQLAGALRQTGEQLGDQDMPMVTDYLGRAATQVEGMSAYLRRTSLRRAVEDLERFARREPVLFMGGAFVAGLLGGRFLKSSPLEQRPRRGQFMQEGAEGAS